MSDRIDCFVLRDGWSDEAVKRALRPGRIVFVEGMSSSFVLNDAGGIEEMSPDEHVQWDEIGTTHGRPQSSDEVDIDDNDFLNSRVGRIGSIYFEQIIDPWQQEWLGEFESDEEALKHAAGAEFDFQR